MKIYLLFGLIITFLVVLHFFYGNETVWVKSELDNNWYLLKDSSLSESERKESANILAEINKRVLILIDKKEDKYPKLKEMYSPKNLSEAAIDKRYTTFTIDKRDIHVCLRTRNNHKKLYDIDRLMYVVIHELAHMANWDPKTGHPIIGHGKEFVNIFRELLSESISLGIYNYRDYSKHPVEYCGIVINSSVI